jgi:hypothetical protein
MINNEGSIGTFSIPDLLGKSEETEGREQTTQVTLKYASSGER